MYQSGTSGMEVRAPDAMYSEAGEDFVLTPYLREICDRALAYLEQRDAALSDGLCIVSSR